MQLRPKSPQVLVEPRPRAQRAESPRGGAGELRPGAQAQGPVRRGAQQPRQRADRARTQRGGARQLQARHRDQARLCGGLLQPGQRAARRSTATTTRSRATTAPSRCARTTPRRIATAARCSTSSAARPTRWCATTARWRSSRISPRRCSTAAARCAGCKRIDETRQRPRTAAGRPSGLRRGALHARHADGGLQPHRRGASRASRGRVALKPDYSKARWASCMAALPILYAEEAQIAAQRADYERRLRALRAAYEAGHIPGDMSQGPRHGAAVLPRLPGPQRSRPADACSAASPARIMADALWRGRARPAAGAGRAGPRRHRQRLLLSAFGLEDRHQGLGQRNSIRSASRCSAITPATSRMPRPRSPAALPQLRAGAALDRTLAADHPRRPAARPALSRTSA